MDATYNYWLVSLSLILAVVASFAALSIAARIPHVERRMLWLWLGGGSLSMGLAIWSMHFVGMLAFHIGIPLAYDIPLTLLSIAYAVIATAIALVVARLEIHSTLSQVISTFFMGSGIAAMHYTGMDALKMSPEIIYERNLFVLSLLIAYVASFVALRLFLTQSLDARASHRLFDKSRFYAALLMGVAIAGMHYTAMEAAIFDPRSICTAVDGGIHSGIMSVLIVMAVILIIALNILLLMLDTKFHDNRRLQLSEQRIRQVINSAPQGMMVIDKQGLIEQVNDTLLTMFGYSKAELIGRSVEILLPAELREKHVQMRRHFMKAPRVRAMGGAMELAAFRKNGEEFRVEIGLSPMKVGGSTSVLATIIDISERITLENARKKAEDVSEYKGLLLANMSHELRTPMHAILGFTRLALKREQDEKNITYLNNISESTNRLMYLINDLLDLSKLEAGKMMAEFQECNMINLVNEQLRLLQSLFHDKKLDVAVNHESLLTAEVDCKLISQVITNLLSNAIKFSPKGGKIKIDLKLPADEPDKFSLLISDQGPGIAPEELGLIFEQFMQSSAIHAVKGTGLGLQICKEIVELHHGSIWATSPLDDAELVSGDTDRRGSVFHVVLPLKQKQASVQAVDA